MEIKRIFTISVIIDIITKGIIRTLIWGIITFCMGFFLIVLKNYINTGFLTKIESIDVWSQITNLYLYLIILALSFSSIIVDIINKKAPDRIQEYLIDMLTRIRLLNIGRFFIKLHIYKSQNATVLPFYKIDELIKFFYKLNKGKIYLFNPPKEFLEADDEFKEIHKAIQSNINNIELVLLIPNQEYNPLKSSIATKLKISESKIKLINSIPPNLKIYAESYIAGVYTGKSAIFPKGKGTEIEYFLNRPLYHPYDEKFTIVQTKDNMEKMIFPSRGVGANNLNRLLEEYIAKIEEIKE